MRSVSNVLESVQRNRNEIQFNHICFGCDVVFVCLLLLSTDFASQLIA